MVKLGLVDLVKKKKMLFSKKKYGGRLVKIYIDNRGWYSSNITGNKKFYSDLDIINIAKRMYDKKFRRVY